MKVIKTKIEGLVIIEPQIFKDQRGQFLESHNQQRFEELVGSISFVQDNESTSSKGVLRGLHFQKPPFAQAKLVRCIKGKVLDVAVDIRANSKTYGEYVAVELSGENAKQLFIPQGFAHGFLTIKEASIFAYKVDSVYAPAHEAGFYWKDKQLNIDWGINKNEVLVSEKDEKMSSFSDFKSPFKI